MIAPGSSPLQVKFILPALIEATGPNWRPIKYSLFPPLGLATLAAYLGPDDEAAIADGGVRGEPGVCRENLPPAEGHRPP